MKLRFEKFGLPTMAAMSGVTMSATTAVTMAVNAMPTATATARSTYVASQDELLEIRKHGASPLGGARHVPDVRRTRDAYPAWGTTRRHQMEPDGARWSPRQESNPRHLHYK